MKKLVIGILAHVDAGKTTLSEGLLYLTGSIRTLGRVDTKNAFLDTYALERARGITIFSKQALFTWKDTEVTLLDTPGHVDFSPEMERTLQVLDYAVLVISGADGVQGHTLTLWRLLERHRIPTFLFINKMDQEGMDPGALMEELKTRLHENCVNFSVDQTSEEFLEALAVCEEEALETYLEMGEVSLEMTAELIRGRRVFPCHFGSALKMTGVEEFLEDLERLTLAPVYGRDFAAKVFKIVRDEQGKRLTYLKITGGTLKVRDTLTGKLPDASGDRWEEKVSQIRRYSGAKYQAVEEAHPGSVCAVAGLTHTYPGEALGAEEPSLLPVLTPVLTYRILLPRGTDVHQALGKLRQLEEEEPQLHIRWEEATGEISAHLMGEVQIDVLKSQIQERFALPVELDAGSIVYKETIAEPVVGGGHFEPLRHYAEVRLLLEPGEPGSGLSFASACSTDELDGNWQRLILTHLEEKEHLGVLTGSPVTDLRITLLAGKAHLKHTEGGDFRQATYRAVRQGLKKAKSILLEPYYDFRLEVPLETVGRAMADIQRMGGTFEEPEILGGFRVLTGSAPVSKLGDYQREVVSYTRGLGRLSCSMKGYFPCHNAEEVIEAIGYDSERDTENPTGSIFCSHGSGFYVPWDKAEDYFHLGGGSLTEKMEAEEALPPKLRKTPVGSAEEEQELEEIFLRTYGPIKDRASQTTVKVTAAADERPYRPVKKKEALPEYLLVDGYNIIFAWKELKELAARNIDSARDRLMDELSNYQGFRKCTVILVFDAYKVEGNPGSYQKYHNIHVIYTKEAETADQYIEKTAHEMGRKYQVTVATSDGVEQVIILGQGCRRLSAAGLKEEMELAAREVRELAASKGQERTTLFGQLSREMAEMMEEVRLGKRML